MDCNLELIGFWPRMRLTFDMISLIDYSCGDLASLSPCLSILVVRLFLDVTSLTELPAVERAGRGVMHLLSLIFKQISDAILPGKEINTDPVNASKQE